MNWKKTAWALSLIATGPFITIWCLNTLFNAGIAYSIYTWFSVIWLTAIINNIHKA